MPNVLQIVMLILSVGLCGFATFSLVRAIVARRKRKKGISEGAPREDMERRE